MLSKNNRKELARKQVPKRQRFTLKKLTVGVASVLIGFTFMGISAATDSTDAQETTDQPAVTDNSGSAAANQQTVTLSNNSSASAATESQSNSSAAQTPAVKSNSSEQNATTATESESTNTTNTLNIGNNTTPVTLNELGENKATPQSQDVSDWSSLINAVEDSSIGIINLDGDITVDGSSNLSSISTNGLFLNKDGIARDLTINGNHHTINFGNYFVKLGNKPQNGGLKWNVIFKDLHVEASGPRDGQYAPLSMGQTAAGVGRNAAVSADNQKNITVTFDGVTANLTGGRYGLISGHQDGNGSVNINNEYYHLVLQGDNTVTSEGFTGYLMPTPGDTGDALSAGYITVKNGTTTVTQHQTSSYNLQYGGAAIRVAQPDKAGQYSIDVKQGATLNINGGKDVKGIVVANATTGTVNIDGNVNMDMGDGHSIAMLAGNLNVGKTGNLDIKTKQVQNYQGVITKKSIENFNAGQYGVLSIGVGYPANTTNQDSNTINDNGVIKIVRSATATTMSPLISMGSGSSGVIKGNFTINVNPGATLDLQDSTQQDNLGMIYVSGSSVKSFVNFNAPKYVNLQRLSSLPSNGGDLIFLEGQPNGTTITQSPIAQWDEDNMSAGPSYVWVVDSVNSMNNWGD